MAPQHSSAREILSALSLCLLSSGVRPHPLAHARCELTGVDSRRHLRADLPHGMAHGAVALGDGAVRCLGAEHRGRVPSLG